MKIIKITFLVIIVSMAILAFTALADASPFLICDPPPQGEAAVEYYKITGLAPFIPDDTKLSSPLRVDLAALPEGNYTTAAIACNMWGCSEPSDTLNFTRPPALSSPGTPSLVAE